MNNPADSPSCFELGGIFRYLLLTVKLAAHIGDCSGLAMVTGKALGEVRLFHGSTAKFKDRPMHERVLKCL